MMYSPKALPLLIGCFLTFLASSFMTAESFSLAPTSQVVQQKQHQQRSLFGSNHKVPTTSLHAASSSTSSSSPDSSSSSSGDPKEIIARRIVVQGPSVQNGYYRACVLNEGGKFRRLTGTMTPPDDSEKAEILVEGNRKQVEGFIRWCKKGNVGLNQVTTVAEILDEEPTGLYEGFYVKTK
mmetsp:Transcript_312/g.755  ORF Transcript_312/g.755 Transcript_312/m.755 type:complete len:181 (+) Transcript_312:243-785(+)